ncbi:MAG: Amuc_1100 family pilus-like protein [Verrucomicrobia bacterium]|nr:Amuc_1100 family pilus-like protein [Verrucomicrobiota bacterium]
MDWIKRNLYFLIGSLVALALMGLAGWYLYSKWQLNNEMLGKLNEQYAELKRLGEQNPHWGYGEVDNIKIAKAQQQQLRSYIQKAYQHFQNCPPIPVPESGKLTSQEFSSALSRTLDQMQRDATKASVTLPPKDASGQAYCFSFAAQSKSLDYARGSLEPLSVQLSEVKAICGVLFQAKVNALDYIRRERVSDDDNKGPQTDYLPEKSVTNDLAILAPYEVRFLCFSSELASVLAGFASAPCGLLVKTINVESAPAVAPAADQNVTPAFATPAYNPPPTRPGGPMSAEDMFARRYGLGGRGGRGMPGMPGDPRSMMPPRPYVPPVATPAPAPTSKGGLPLALDEKQLKITLMLIAVKPLPSK